MHYYQFNIGDYTSHTAHLDPLEDLAYRRMIDVYFLNECPLPKEPEEVARLIRMRTHCDCIANVLREFFTPDGNSWRHGRIDADIAAFRAKSKKAKKSAEARWHNKAKNDDANALRTECEGNANHKPLTKNQEPVKDIGAISESELSTTTAPAKAAAKSKRGARLPDDWDLTDEYVEAALAINPRLNVYQEADKFKDYWIAKTGQAATKLDWLATWRNWIRNTKSGGGNNGPHQQDTRSRAKRVSDELDRIAREDIARRGGVTGSLG